MFANLFKSHVHTAHGTLDEVLSYLPPGLILAAAVLPIDNGKHIKSFAHEFFGSLLMIACTFSAGKWIGTSNLSVAWLSHAIGVVLSDYIGGGPHVNPAVTMAMYSLNKCSYTEGYVRIAAQIAGGLVAFPAFQALSDQLKWPALGGPEFNMSDDKNSTTEAFLSEFTATLLLMFAIYLLNWELNFGKKYHYIIKQFLTAVVIRALIEFFPTAGPAMNPMLATTWDVFGVGNSFEFPKHFAHYFVYWVAPCTAALLSALLYTIYAGGKFFGMTMPIGPFKKSKAGKTKAKKTKVTANKKKE